MSKSCEKGERIVSDNITIKRSSRIALVLFDRSDHLNAMPLDLMHELTEVALAFEDDLDTNGVVVTGSPKGARSQRASIFGTPSSGMRFRARQGEGVRP